MTIMPAWMCGDGVSHLLTTQDKDRMGFRGEDGSEAQWNPMESLMRNVVEIILETSYHISWVCMWLIFF